MKFNLEEYRKNPDRKLILRNHTGQGPVYWDITEIAVSLGDIIVIKPRGAELDLPSHIALDRDSTLKHEVYGNIGALEFANEELTMAQFIERLIALPVDCSVDFSCGDDVYSAAFGVTKLKRFDTTLLLFSKYGGGNGCSGCYDVGKTVDKVDFEEYLKCFLEDYFVDYFYIDTANIDKELWGISFEHTNVDGLTFRRLVTSNPIYPFFASKQEAELFISQHPNNDFDEEFDSELCSKPEPVLLGRWSICKHTGRCIKLI